jgi:hypothetical protein
MSTDITKHDDDDDDLSINKRFDKTDNVARLERVYRDINLSTYPSPLTARHFCVHSNDFLQLISTWIRAHSKNNESNKGRR